MEFACYFLFFRKKKQTFKFYVNRLLTEDIHVLEISRLIFFEKVKKKNTCLYIYFKMLPAAVMIGTLTLPASDDFCRLLITFANGLDLDQVGCFVRPDLDPNCLTF